MSNPKDQIYKAKRKARHDLERVGYIVTLLQNGVFDIEAVRRTELRKIKICLDTVTTHDKLVVFNAILPESCTKEIWCKKVSEANFEFYEFLNSANLVKR